MELFQRFKEKICRATPKEFNSYDLQMYDQKHNNWRSVSSTAYFIESYKLRNLLEELDKSRKYRIVQTTTVYGCYGHGQKIDQYKEIF